MLARIATRAAILLEQPLTNLPSMIVQAAASSVAASSVAHDNTQGNQKVSNVYKEANKAVNNKLSNNSEFSAGEIYICAEYDEEVKAKLSSVLDELGAKIIKKNGGIAGSQEYVEHDIVIKGKNITYTSETYMGVNLTGDQNTLDEIKRKLSFKS